MWGASSMDRVADFESVGWGFESLAPHHMKTGSDFSGPVFIFA